MKTHRILAVALGAALSLSAQPPDFTPPTPFFRVVLANDTAGVKQQLEAGANPNEGKFLGFVPVFFPIINQNIDMLRAMVAKGADVQVRDGVGSTTLMWAAYDENGRPELVEELMKIGVDPNAKNKNGETALTWALRRGYTPVVAALKKGGASDGTMIRESVEKALALLQKSGPEFVKVSGCTSCHNQSLPQMAAGLARARGFGLDEQLSQQSVKAVMAMFRPMREEMLKGTEKLPDPPIFVGYALAGLAAEGYKPDETTEAMAHLLATQQLPDGGFGVLAARPPLEGSTFTAAALSIRGMQTYGKDTERQVAMARKWLERSQPKSTEDRAMQLLGLTWAKADPEYLGNAARALLASQRPDGGWAQLPNIETDAYATGQALVALRLSGQVPVTDSAYQHGIGFLLRSQLSDGSWLVRSRTFPFQPYKESGFPHGKNQWISAAGTSWASMALTLAVPTDQPELSRLF